MLAKNSTLLRNIIPIHHKRTSRVEPDLQSKHSPRQEPQTSRARDKQNFCSNTLTFDLCVNHPDKSAKFFVTSDEEQVFKYCEKCAIQLASKGFAVQKLERPRAGSPGTWRSPQLKEKPKARRQAQIESFLAKVQKLREGGEQKLQRLQEEAVQVSAQYEQEVRRAQSYYECLMKLVQAAAERTQASLQEQLQAAEQKISERAQLVSSKLSYITVIKKDIESTKDNIINSVKEEDFRPIMAHYSQCTSEFEQLLAVEQEVPAPGILEDTQTLAEEFSKLLMERFLVRAGSQPCKDEQSQASNQEDCQTDEKLIDCESKKGSMLLGSEGSLYFSFDHKNFEEAAKHSSELQNSDHQ